MWYRKTTDFPPSLSDNAMFQKSMKKTWWIKHLYHLYVISWKTNKKDQGSQEISNLTDVLSWYRGLFISVDWLGYIDISKLLVKIKYNSH